MVLDLVNLSFVLGLCKLMLISGNENVFYMPLVLDLVIFNNPATDIHYYFFGFLLVHGLKSGDISNNYQVMKVTDSCCFTSPV